MELRNYAWGVGGVADNLLTYGLATTLVPIFNLGYGVNAFWLGVALFVPRFVDILTDPIMAVISDRTRSRFGRRRPYIFVGAILMAVCFAFLWLPPAQRLVHDAANAATGEGGGLWGLPPFPKGEELKILLWVGGVYTLLTFPYTMFGVPYVALGYEFTRNTDVMTRVMASRLYFTTIASVGVAWVYRLAVADRFGGDETVGMRVIGVYIAVLVALTGIVPALVCTEPPPEARPRPSADWREIARAAFGNKANVLMLGTLFIFVLGLFSSGAMSVHVNVFYVAQGDKQFGAWLGAVSGNIMLGCNLVGMALMAWLSRRFDKRSVALGCFSLVFLGNALYLLTWSPAHPHAQFINAFLIGLGYSGIWLMIDSMVGDVAKDDEVRHGVAREGLFGAGRSFVFKISVALTSLTGAYALSVSGFDPAVPPSSEVQDRLRLIYIALQCAGAAAAFALVWFFPITRARAEANERILADRARA